MTKTRKLKQINCNPNVRGKTIKKHSCLTPNVLLEIKNNYNKYNHNKITTNNPKYIWSTLRRKLHHCDNEMCWIDEFDDIEIRNAIKKKVFAPLKPSEWKHDPNTWLSNYDILKVLRQYEEKYPCFVILGPTPIDFDELEYDYGGFTKCVNEMICKFDLASMKNKGKTKIGVIFNLSKHTERGSHWVSLFINMNEGYILFFDSGGKTAPNEVNNLVKKVQQQGKEMDIDMKYIENKIRHQHTSTECGMYSLYFIITMLNEKINGKEVTQSKLKSHFLNGRISDDYVFKRRNIYFN